ncbi:hypothetical protein [Janibacter melonis]|uniref:hypothetical protein n=1 Tax=Janibacter melonis TaxID=262209 RepID=UPI00191B2DC5|nr:hypothetical protein [Janibacter melonis]
MAIRVGRALLVAVLATSACGITSPPRGDEIRLSGEEDAAELCLPGGDDIADMSFGMETVRVTGDVPVELVAVHLVEPQDFELVQAYVAPERVRGSFGGLTGWPGQGVSRQTLDALQPIPGAVLPPAQDLPEDERRPGLVLHLRGAAGARFEGFTVDYRLEGSDKVLRTDRSHQRMSVGDCGG